uniref:Proteasome maturation protein n=1 Tax=Equus asinus TaxID=9793 RepID=A0A9L0KKU3_EQUAS
RAESVLAERVEDGLRRPVPKSPVGLGAFPGVGAELPRTKPKVRRPVAWRLACPSLWGDSGRVLKTLARPGPRNRPDRRRVTVGRRSALLCGHFREFVACQTLEGKKSDSCCSPFNARGLGSQLKDSIPVTELSASGPFESHDLLRKGFSCVKNELLPSHPLELSEKNFQLNQDKMNFSTLRNIQGLFAPLKLQMEFKAVQQVQRLPFLPSSNLSLDILRGNDETIGFEDILNDPAQSELMGEPHLMVEYKLGLL